VRLQVGTTEELFATFWKSLTQIVTDELANAARSASALSFLFCVFLLLFHLRATRAALLTDRVFTPGSQFVETAFVGEYPKLLRLFNDLLKRLRTHMEVKDPKDESR
jgi:hypothetical protein